MKASVGMTLKVLPEVILVIVKTKFSKECTHLALIALSAVSIKAEALIGSLVLWGADP